MATIYRVLYITYKLYVGAISSKILVETRKMQLCMCKFNIFLDPQLEFTNLLKFEPGSGSDQIEKLKPDPNQNRVGFATLPTARLPLH